MEIFNYLPNNGISKRDVFNVNSAVSAIGWTVWRKRPGISMVHILAIGGGGGGGAGAVGAAGSAAGGGGGGSGSQCSALMPAMLLPDELYVSVGCGGNAATAGNGSWVSVYPDSTGNQCIARSNGGGAGGNAAGATGGAAGAAATVPSSANANLGFAGMVTFLVGQAGTAGGTTISPASIAYGNTGLMVMGGPGGAGVPASGANAGGTIAAITNFPAVPTAAAPVSATQPGTDGSNGLQVSMGLGTMVGFWYPGFGGSSSFATATGAGLFGGKGGSALIGSGGGGGGGCLTGGTAGAGGRGGDGLVIITAW